MTKTALVIYSKTGHTLEVAKRIQLKKEFDLLMIEATSDDPNQPFVELIEIPDIIDYDHVILGSPVHGFRISKIMNAYLTQLPDLKGKTFDLFVTQFFPFAWMGANQSIKQMQKIIKQKNGTVRQVGRVSWRSRKKEIQILNIVKTMQD